MLPLEELKQALEHDKAQKAPAALAPNPRLQARIQLRAATRQVDEAVLQLALEHFGDGLLDVPLAIEAIDRAIAALQEASRVLTAAPEKPEVTP